MIGILLDLIAQFNFELARFGMKKCFLVWRFERRNIYGIAVGFRVIGQQHLESRLKKSLYRLSSSMVYVYFLLLCTFLVPC